MYSSYGYRTVEFTDGRTRWRKHQYAPKKHFRIDLLIIDDFLLTDTTP